MRNIDILLRKKYSDLYNVMVRDLSTKDFSLIQSQLKNIIKNVLNTQDDEKIIKEENISEYDKYSDFKFENIFINTYLLKSSKRFLPVILRIFKYFIVKNYKSMFYGFPEDLDELLENPPITIFSSVLYIYYLTKRYYGLKYNFFDVTVSRKQKGQKTTNVGFTEIITNQYIENITVNLKENDITGFLLQVLYNASIWDFLLLNWLINWNYIEKESVLSNCLLTITRNICFNFFKKPFSFFEDKNELLRDAFFNGFAINSISCITNNNQKYNLSRDSAVFLIKVLDTHFNSYYMDRNARFSTQMIYISEFFMVFFYRFMLTKKKLYYSNVYSKFIVNGQGLKFNDFINRIFRNYFKRVKYLIDHDDLLKRYYQQIIKMNQKLKNDNLEKVKLLN